MSPRMTDDCDRFPHSLSVLRGDRQHHCTLARANEKREEQCWTLDERSTRSEAT